MTLTEAQKQKLKEHRQLVIVQTMSDIHIFLTDDVAKPQVLGLPENCIASGFSSIKFARKEINNIYRELKYQPQCKGHKDVFGSKTRAPVG